MQIYQERYGKGEHVSLVDCVREPEASVFCRHGQRHHRAHWWRTQRVAVRYSPARGETGFVWADGSSLLLFITFKRWKDFHHVLDRFTVSTLPQAQRARSMGAIVYCVGVKEFNQTQVRVQRLRNANTLRCIVVIGSVCYSSLQLLPTPLSTCFPSGAASKLSEESSTQYDTHTYIPTYLHTYIHTHTQHKSHMSIICH